MEGLSAAASIITALDAAHEVVKICYDFRAALKQSPWVLTRILDEATDLQAVIAQIERQPFYTGGAGANTALVLPCDPQRGPLRTCADELASLKRMLESSVLQGKSGSRRRAMIQTIGWRLKDCEVSASIERVQRCKATLQLALAVNETASLMNINALTQALETQVGSVDSKIVSISNSIDRKGAGEPKDKLRYPAGYVPPARLNLTNTPGGSTLPVQATGSSMTQVSRVGAIVLLFSGFRVHLALGKLYSCKDRLVRDLKALLFTNAAYLSSTIVQHFLEKRSASELVAYFYCDFRQKELCHIENVLATLVAQLCQMAGTLPQELETFFEEAHILGEAARPKPSMLRHVLMNFAQKYSVTLMIDAADESDCPGELARLLKTLNQPQEILRVLITSRDQAELREELGSLNQLKLQNHRSDANADIKSYITSQLETNARLSALKSHMQEEISEGLQAKSNGMFRWVQCQLDAISTLRTARAIRSALHSLPRGLEETYRRILYDVASSDRQNVCTVLRWLSFAITPLSLLQLADAVAIEHDKSEIDDDNRLTHPDDLLNICRSLVAVTEQDKLILAHFSVEDYLLSESLRHDKHIRAFSLQTESSVQMLFDCLTYLNFQEFATGPSTSQSDLERRYDRYPLLNQISKAWPYYFHACEFSDDARSKVLKFFDSSNRQCFLSWVQVLNAHRFEQWDRWPRQATSLYYASSFGLQTIVRRLLLDTKDINASASRYGATALHGATSREHVSVMKLLLEAGADPNKQDYTMLSPLHTAVIEGNKDIVRMLLNYGASPKLPGCSGQSPLDWARRSKELTDMLSASDKAQECVEL